MSRYVTRKASFHGEKVVIKREGELGKWHARTESGEIISIDKCDAPCNKLQGFLLRRRLLGLLRRTEVACHKSYIGQLRQNRIAKNTFLPYPRTKVRGLRAKQTDQNDIEEFVDGAGFAFEVIE